MTNDTLKKSDLLIVDDNPQNLQVLAKLLQLENYNIEFAVNGEAALEWLNYKEFDLVLLDINMPGKDGFEVCKTIRSQDRFNNIPIIFLTAETERETILKGFKLGGQDFVTKPFDSSELIARVKTHLNLKNALEKVEGFNRTLEEKIEERTSQLKIALEKAEESDRLKSAFLANISHEIRTPMNGILGFINLLEKPDLSREKYKDYTKIINESGQRMLNIINNIVELSKIESGNTEIQIQKIQINQILKFLYNFFTVEAEKKGLGINYHCEITDDEFTIETDKKIITNILTHLIENAIKFTNSGSINFGYKCTGDYLEFFIIDTGIGITPEKKSAIFERFVQADYSSTREYEGAGISLTIAKSYIELLKGKIWVDSEPGKGSKFFFTIPLKLTYDNNKKYINDGIIKFDKPFNILIVDDDIGSIFYFKEILNYEKLNLHFAKNGKEAIDKVKAVIDLDLILMDLQMPIMDGFKATNYIKKIKPNLPIIAQTAHTMHNEEGKAKETGCDDYISKPIQPFKLIHLINKYKN